MFFVTQMKYFFPSYPCYAGMANQCNKVNDYRVKLWFWTDPIHFCFVSENEESTELVRAGPWMIRRVGKEKRKLFYRDRVSESRIIAVNYLRLCIKSYLINFS